MAVRLALAGFAAENIYKGDSTDDKDCVLTYTGNFPASRLLFMAIEFTGK